MTVPNNANVYLPPSPVIPKSLLITNITNSLPMVVTITGDNTYIQGQVITLTVPYDYGMYQANGLQSEIIAVVGDDFYLPIDSTKFDVFTSPTSSAQPASIAPSGSRNLYNVTTVPFKSENGQLGN